MLLRVATNLHENMRRAGVDPPPIGVIAYSLDIIANTVSITAATLAIGLMSGNLSGMMTCLGALAALRFVSGGVHLPTSAACIALSTAIITTIPYLPLSPGVNQTITAAAFIIVAVRATTNYDKHARIPRKYYPLMRIVACVIVASNFVIASDILALTYIVQAVTLLPFLKEVKTR
ncbi:accessory gene regulator B family protein [Paenibacillus humicus]|uniref:accessory gene regulator B family protein n=1 Tax=Paenibacillus humicus TaxID=412861 RepID=UPI0013E3B47D|nr:accessory gene regulator B family protein [Paenibacillus humicus]